MQQASTDVLQIGDFCQTGSGGTPLRSAAANFDGGTIPWVKSGELKSRLVESAEEMITEAALRTSSAKLVPKGALLVAMYGATVGEVSELAVDAATNQAVCHIVPDSARCDRNYLFHALVANKQTLLSRRVGGAQPNISQGIIKSLEIPLPSLVEQRHIAAILDKADALRAKRREAIAKLDQLLRSVFVDMFGDPVTNPKKWPKATLSELFEIARGGSPRPIDDYITDDASGINWIMIGDTVEGSKYITGTKKKIRPEGVRRSRQVKPGDFLLTNSMSFGRPYILRTSGCIHDGWLVLSPKASRTNTDYLFSVLASSSLYVEFARRAPGATVKNLNIDLVSGVEIPVPDTAMQAEFSRRIGAIEAAQASQQMALKGAEELFLSVQAQAFSAVL